VGICASCACKNRLEAIREAVAPALATVPPVYDASWGEAELFRRVPDLAACRRPAADFLSRPVLMLHGPTGAGKSSLAGALFRFIVGGIGPDSVQGEVDFAAAARWVESRDVPADGAAAAWRASAVVLDDVGQEGGAGESFAAQDRFRVMADLLDKLYTHRVFGHHRARIILTTYGTHETWRKWYGAGIARRYWEDADHVLKVKLDRR
jgi:hypothetical protein